MPFENARQWLKMAEPGPISRVRSRPWAACRPASSSVCSSTKKRPPRRPPEVRHETYCQRVRSAAARGTCAALVPPSVDYPHRGNDQELLTSSPHEQTVLLAGIHGM